MKDNSPEHQARMLLCRVAMSNVIVPPAPENPMNAELREAVEAERLETLADVLAWHRRRAEFFSHHGMPWGAMGHESKRCADIITAHLGGENNG